MFHMMNEARIGSVSAPPRLATPATSIRCEYARERPQGRPPALKDPSAPQVPIIEHADVRRMLLAQKS